MSERRAVDMARGLGAAADLPASLLLVVTLFVLRVGKRVILRLQAQRNLPDAAILPVRRLLRTLVLAPGGAGGVCRCWACR